MSKSIQDIQQLIKIKKVLQKRLEIEFHLLLDDKNKLHMQIDKIKDAILQTAFQRKEYIKNFYSSLVQKNFSQQNLNSFDHQLANFNVKESELIEEKQQMLDQLDDLKAIITEKKRQIQNLKIKQEKYLYILEVSEFWNGNIE